jgi:two-component system NtrC family response regulator
VSAAADSQVQATKLLIVDDDPVMLSQLGLALGSEYQVFTAENPRQAWKLVEEEHPELVTLDLALEQNDPETGFSLLEKCLEFDPFVKIVLITGNDTQDNALRAVDQGAFDFFGKPLDLEALRHLLRRADRVARLERENAALLHRVGHHGRLGHLLGGSTKMQSVFDAIRKVAPTDVSILILGESGTGKELVAREMRRLSRRATKPFVQINCGAIPDNLLESELFGHEKGAYTGAHTSRPGKLEMAHGGTVFLDEIGEVPAQLQVKLLRFLQEREVERVGGRTVLKIDARVIAATNKDLASEVKAGRFREDLYYRLAVVNIRLPPLRERPDDVIHLAQYFLERFAGEMGKQKLSFSRRARQALQHYSWPGNVRELEHHVQKAVVFATGHLVHAADLELEPGNRLESLSLRQVREQNDRRTIVQALRRTCGNISKAAQELEISRPSLHDLLRKHDIDASRYKSATEPNDEEPEK